MWLVYIALVYFKYFYIHIYIVGINFYIYKFIVNIKYSFAVLHFLYTDTVVKKSIMEREAEWEELRWDLKPNKVKVRWKSLTYTRPQQFYFQKYLRCYWFFVKNIRYWQPITTGDSSDKVNGCFRNRPCSEHISMIIYILFPIRGGQPISKYMLKMN